MLNATFTCVISLLFLPVFEYLPLPVVAALLCQVAIGKANRCDRFSHCSQLVSRVADGELVAICVQAWWKRTRWFATGTLTAGRRFDNCCNCLTFFLIASSLPVSLSCGQDVVPDGAGCGGVRDGRPDLGHRPRMLAR